VQLYVRDQAGSVTRPVKELKDFQRVTLSPGEKKTVEFKLSPEQIAFLNLRMQLAAEPGMFTVFVGPNSRDILQAEFEYVK
jgi:beta-glucosidase